jgi:UDP-glucose 4-epimerase
MKHISVIGATSPLGVHLVSKLVGEGFNVTASFRLSDRIPNEWHQVSLISPVCLDLTDAQDSAAFKSDIIVWLAHLNASRDNIFEVDVNLTAFENFLRNVDSSLSKKIIFISSGGSIYGPQNSIPIAEDQERRPISSYGKAKLALENRLLDFGRTNGIKIAILRPGNIYGFESPFRFSKGVVGAFLRSLDNKSSFTLIHGGNTVRDFVYVDDVCEAILLSIQKSEEQIIWNVSTGVGHTINDVLDKILRHTGEPMPKLVQLDNFDSDVLINVLSSERIKRESSWIAKTDLETGVFKTVKKWQTALRSHIQTV